MFGLAVPLTTTIQKQKSPPKAAAIDPLVGRWNRHVNTEPIEGFSQYIELKNGNRYSFGTVVRDRHGKDRLEEEGFGSWKRNGQTFRFTADPKSRQAMLLEEAELVDGTMLRFSPLHAFCKRAHPHDQVREEARPAPSQRSADAFLRKLKEENFHSFDKRTKLSYDLYLVGTNSFEVESTKEQSAAALAAARKVLDQNGVRGYTLKWVLVTPWDGGDD